MRIAFAAAAAALLLTTSACEVTVQDGDTNEAAVNRNAQPAEAGADPYASNRQSVERALQLAAAQGSAEERTRLRNAARGEFQNLRFVVDISDRELRMFDGDRQVAKHPIAVGSEEWPTPTGSWQFHRVDLNPEWVPPNEEWASGETRKAPGDPENPMGKARLVYRMPNTVHGTDDLNSLGKAVSHGSIRVANEVALSLAETLLKAGGAWEGPQWFQQMKQNRTEEYQVELADHIPIKVQD